MEVQRLLNQTPLEFAFPTDYLHPLSQDLSVAQASTETKLQPYKTQYFTPAQEDLFFTAGPITQRICFYREPCNWTATELKYLRDFRDFLLETKRGANELPDDFPEQELLKNLLANEGNCEQAYADTLTQLKWRRETLPLQL